MPRPRLESRRFILPLLTAASGSLATLPSASAALLADWEFSGTVSNTGTTVDSSGNAYDGTLTGFDSDSSTGLDGSGQVIFSANNANRIITTMPLNFEADFQVDVTFTYSGAANRIWTPLLGSSSSPYSDSQIFFLGKNSGDTQLHVNIAGVHIGNFAAGAFLFAGDRHNLVLSYEKATDKVELYGDGNRAENGTIISLTTTLWIGATGHVYR